MAIPGVDGELDRSRCWCCGGAYPISDMVGLGEHPEVSICLGCAHFLHQRAREREDARTPSLPSRVRDGLRAVRRFVMRHGLHHKPVIGPVLRWLGRRAP